MKKSRVQQCPICGAHQRLEASRCNQCGAALAGIPSPETSRVQIARHGPRSARMDGPAPADWDAGEADLYEGMLPRLPLKSIVISLLTIVIIGGFALYVVSQYVALSVTPTPLSPSLEILWNTPEPGGEATRRVLPTNTRVVIVPTLPLPTVTPMPPTVTLTPTRGPCIQKAVKDDTVYGMAVRCGHKDMAVVEEILQRNNMSSAAELQIGQELDIPWPTPIGGAPQPEGTQEAGNGGAMSGLEPTLPPSLTWYTVKKGDTAVNIVFTLNITMRILKDLNAEVLFEGCDFGLPGGGPECRVPLFEGQRLVVPAPTPTPTIPATPSGSETPTPSATATFNKPIDQSPSDNMIFESFELPTLRWTSTAQLGPDEVYLVTVVNRTLNITFTATTRELSFQLPQDWQPNDQKRHTFAWTITIATQKGNKVIPSNMATETRTFTWQAR